MQLILRTAFLSFMLTLGASSALAQKELTCGAPSPFAQKWDQVRQSTAYIYFDVTDPATGAKATVQGTGFVVSRLGYVLTAAHLLRDWSRQTQAEKDDNPIRASLGDKPGYVTASPLILSVISPGNPDSPDFALLKLPDPDRHAVQGYNPAPICLTSLQESAMGDAFLAFGFPLGKNIQPVPGVLGTKNADGDRWAAAGAFANGMSGGPVYDAGGNLIGMVKGGLTETEAVRWITPIRHAENLLRMAGVSQECSGIGFVQRLNVTILNKTLRAKPLFKTFVVDSIIESVHLLVIDSESGAPISRASVKVSGPQSNSPVAQGDTDEHGEFVFKLYYERLHVRVRDRAHQEIAATLHLPSPNRLHVLIPMTGRCLARRQAALSRRE
jgi:S1-C subfamily serine protease